MFQTTLARLMSAVAGAAAVAVASVPCQAQSAFESIWSDSASFEDFSYRAIETLSVGGTSSSTFIVAGSSHIPGVPGYSDLSYWDSAGQQTWLGRVSYGLSGAGATLAFRSVHQMSNGDLLVAGHAQTGGSPTNFVMRLSSPGFPLWNIGSSFSFTGDTNTEAIELTSNGNIAVIDTVGLAGGPITRLTYHNPLNGSIIASRALATSDGGNIILSDIQEDPASGLIYGAGSLQYPFQPSVFACIVRINPSLPIASQFTGVWIYHDPTVTDTAFNAIEIVGGGSTTIYAAGICSTLSWPSSTVNARVVRITNLTTMKPAVGDDLRYGANLVPANGGLKHIGTSMCGLGAWTDLLYLAGTTNSGHLARLMVLNGLVAPTPLSLTSFGGGTPPYTSFAGVAIDPSASKRPVMVGSHRANALPTSEYQAYVVRTGCDFGTGCSPASAFSASSVVATSWGASTPALLPVQVNAGGGQIGIPVSIQRPVNLGLPVVHVTFHPCAGCKWDGTTGAVPGQPGYGVPNGILNNEDFFYYIAQFSAGNLAVADMTTGAIAGQPGYGVANGVINNDDFFYYLGGFSGGC